MKIQLADTEEEITRCFAVLQQLRKNLQADPFLSQVRRMQAEGFQLVYLTDADEVKTVGGFRITELLAGGRFLYVEDLVTNEADRAHGYGQALFAWLVAYAKTAGCIYLHLDSPVQMFAAHRFYVRQRMDIVCHHFGIKL